MSMHHVRPADGFGDRSRHKPLFWRPKPRCWHKGSLEEGDYNAFEALRRLERKALEGQPVLTIPAR
jgi:hypothetical protein